MLLENGNDTVGSGFGGTLSGSGTINYSVTYDQGGFTGLTWNIPAMGGDVLEMFGSYEALESYIISQQVFVAQAVGMYPLTNNANCATYEITYPD